MPSINQFHVGKGFADCRISVVELKILSITLRIVANHNLYPAPMPHRGRNEFEGTPIATEHYVRVERRQQEPQSPTVTSAPHGRNWCKPPLQGLYLWKKDRRRDPQHSGFKRL